ncbi:MAG: hypothetical protein HUJ91_06690, partial [Bacteroidales bacterium]|nr:hypothetical protein [Bacteroidales bacterium]
IRYEEYSTLSALKEVLTPPALPKGGDVIAWLDAFYINQMRGYLLGQEALDAKVMNKSIDRLSSLQKGDGGWGWFPCCESSDLLTMLFLERVYHIRKTATLPSKETLSLQVARAVGFVDARIVEMSAQKDWSVRQMGEMLSIRTLYPQYPMSPNVKQALAAYLDKTRSGWQQMPVLAKAHHCRVLASAGEKEMLAKVVASLKDYAVKNNTVGCYFPNAVMPWRGLMHTEIYAHSLLVEVFDMVGEKEMVKGLTQWLLLQKHNQKWGSVGASSDAVYALVSHSQEDLRFGAVYYTYTTPMIDALPDASGISVSREYYLDGKKLEDGDVLRPGNRVDAVYKVCSDENRSFVEMTAMRPACFYPTDERSYGSWGWYCEKEASQTKFYFQLLPEETTELRESFFVVQEGVFNSGLVEIFSKYAPEYRGHTGATQVVSHK